jgi:hypothetical protein
MPCCIPCCAPAEIDAAALGRVRCLDAAAELGLPDRENIDVRVWRNGIVAIVGLEVEEDQIAAVKKIG